MRTTFNRGGSRGRVQGVRTPPEMKPSSYSLLKFVYLTSQSRRSLVVYPLLRKILDPPLFRLADILARESRSRKQSRDFASGPRERREKWAQYF